MFVISSGLKVAAARSLRRSGFMVAARVGGRGGGDRSDRRQNDDDEDGDLMPERRAGPKSSAEAARGPAPPAPARPVPAATPRVTGCDPGSRDRPPDGRIPCRGPGEVPERLLVKETKVKGQEIAAEQGEEPGASGRRHSAFT